MHLKNTQRRKTGRPLGPFSRVALTLVATVAFLVTAVAAPMTVLAEGGVADAVQLDNTLVGEVAGPQLSDGQTPSAQASDVTISSLNSGDLTILDTVKTNGHFVLQLKVGEATYVGAEAAQILVDNGYIVTWSDGTTSYGGGYSVYINGIKTAAVEENGGWVNVALTNGAQKTYTVTATKDGASVSSASLLANYNDSLVNGSFENDKMGWATTASDGQIEIGLGSDMNNKYLHTNEPMSNQGAYEGSHFAEINAEAAGALYQDVLTVPGVEMNWKFAHRARTNSGSTNFTSSAIESTDEMAMIIAPYELVENITTQDQLLSFYKQKLESAKDTRQVKVVGDGVYGERGVSYTVYVCYDAAEITNGGGKYWKWPSSKWDERTGTYAVPEGQCYTRFFFMAINTAYDKTQTRNSPYTVGNLLDDVWFSQEQPPAAQDEAQLTVTKYVKGLNEEDATRVLATEGLIAVTSGEGAGEKNVTLVGIMQESEGVYKATYTETVKNVTSGNSIRFTVSEDAGKAEVDGFDRSTTVTGEGGSAGSDNMSYTVSVKAGSTATVTFTNTYTPKTVVLENAMSATKTLMGRNSKEGEIFTVQLSAVDYKTLGGQDDESVTVPMPDDDTLSFGDLSDETKSDSQSFGEITYRTTGVYTYKIAEVVPSDGSASVDVNYSTAEYTVEVTVSQGADGRLEVASVMTDAGGNVVGTADFVNTVKTYGLQILKQDTDQNGLQGAEFQLLDASGGVVTSTPSDESGYAYFTGLKPGTYTLKESKVPAGHQILTGEYTLEIVYDENGVIKATLTSDDIEHVADGDLETVVRQDSADAATFTMTITNSSIADLPQTGGIGNGPLYIAGAALIAGAVVFVDRKRREA